MFVSTTHMRLQKSSCLQRPASKPPASKRPLRTQLHAWRGFLCDLWACKASCLVRGPEDQLALPRLPVAVVGFARPLREKSRTRPSREACAPYSLPHRRGSARLSRCPGRESRDTLTSPSAPWREDAMSVERDGTGNAGDRRAVEEEGIERKRARQILSNNVQRSKLSRMSYLRAGLARAHGEIERRTPHRHRPIPA